MKRADKRSFTVSEKDLVDRNQVLSYSRGQLLSYRLLLINHTDYRKPSQRHLKLPSRDNTIESC